MIRKFIWERKGWFLLFLFMQLLLIFVAFLESEMSVSSILYVVFLSTLIFILFIIARYAGETKFYKELEEWDSNLNVTGLPEPHSPFEKIIHEKLVEQAEQLRQETAENRMLIEQEKDELLSWIHEVKTPMTAMSLMIESIIDPELKGPLTYEWLRIHLLLDQQLHQKRIHFIENDLYIKKADLEEIIYGEIKTLQSWCIQKGIGFDIDLEIKEVLSDSKWLAFMLRQLLTNAVKYSEAGDIHIMSYRENGRTVLSIKDFGRGINAKDLPRIFDKGFTSTVDHHQNTASTGMGLYLAKRVAGPMHIEMRVESIQGEGSTFTLIFPKKNEFIHTMGM